MDAATLEWLSDPSNPPVRYLTALNLADTPPSDAELAHMRAEIFGWPPLLQILDLQLDDGGFPYPQKTHTAQSAFSALELMARCGLEIDDEPVARTVDFLANRHMKGGVVSFTGGGSGALPCYAGSVAHALIRMNGVEHEIVQSALRWLIAHQRFDHKELRAGGEAEWKYKAPVTYRCWESVSCYHGVAAAFRAVAAVPSAQRTADMNEMLRNALEYLRIHRLYKKTTTDRPLFRHMTEFFLVGDYRSHLLDMLQGIVDADPALIREDWVREAVADMEAHTRDGRVPLAKNYGKRLADPIPLEPAGESSRFLTYQWMLIRRRLAEAA